MSMVNGKWVPTTHDEQLILTIIDIVDEWEDSDMDSSDFITRVEEAVQEFKEAGEI